MIDRDRRACAVGGEVGVAGPPGKISGLSIGDGGERDLLEVIGRLVGVLVDGCLLLGGDRAAEDVGYAAGECTARNACGCSRRRTARG